MNARVAICLSLCSGLLLMACGGGSDSPIENGASDAQPLAAPDVLVSGAQQWRPSIASTSRTAARLMNVIVTGAGAGGGPRVRAFNAAGVPFSTDFPAYECDWPGGVRVAVGDLNGDGQAEIITGAGPGGAARVRVFAGNGAALVTDFHAYTNSSGGVFVAAADLDGDGKAEIITGAGRGGSPHVRAFKADGHRIPQTRTDSAPMTARSEAVCSLRRRIWTAMARPKSSQAPVPAAVHTFVPSRQTARTPYPADPDGFGAYEGNFRGGAYVAATTELRVCELFNLTARRPMTLPPRPDRTAAARFFGPTKGSSTPQRTR